MSWFLDLWGFEENPRDIPSRFILDGDTLISRVNQRRLVWGALEILPLRDLPPGIPGPRRLKLQETVASVQSLHRAPENSGALFQVASQFNLLEMISPQVTPEAGITRYAQDATQGPACALSAPAGTLYRNYFIPLDPQNPGQTQDRQVNTLKALEQALQDRLNLSGPLWTLKNGYLLEGPQTRRLLQDLEALTPPELRTLEGSLMVGLQKNTQVVPGPETQRVHQVYASALGIAYTGWEDRIWEPLARLILRGAYRCTLAWSAALGVKKVFLTLLGGGVFGNPRPWILEALAGALEEYQSLDLRVFIVSYRQSAPDVQNLVKNWNP